jgi:hypothetical protein
MFDVSGNIRQLRWHGEIYLRRIYYNLKFRNPSSLLGRHACLGAEVMRLLKPKHSVINVQKGRIDYLCSCWDEHRIIANAVDVIPHMQRDTIIPCIIQEEILYDWLRPKKPVALFMDSMPELGDQMFVHNDLGWQFLSAYGDLEHSESFKRDFRCTGLLPLEDLESKFEVFFRKVRKKYGDIPIFYLHFPPKLETRKKYIERHDAIQAAINNLSKKFQPFFSISADDSIVGPPDDVPSEMKDFPYHYNSDTYHHFVNLILETGAWNFSETNFK